VLLDTTPRRIGRWLALSLALHAPLTPVLGLVGLVHLLGNQDDIPTLPPVTEIPLDIIDDDTPPAGKPGETPATPEPEAVAEPTPKEPEPAVVKKPKKLEEPKDAGVDAQDPLDAGAPDASKASDAGAADAGAADAGAPAKPGEGIGSPVAGISDRRVVDPNANVQVLVHNDRVRAHPLGGRVGPMLRNVYQWRDFFGPTSIDPMRDIDRMLIIGPQLRDSSQVVAILKFNAPQEKVRAAVDVLVARDPEGGWVEDSAVPVAKAHADRGERVFVFPSPGILVVTPPSAQSAAEKLGKKFHLPGPKGDEIAIAKLATPWRAFRGMPVKIPESIRSAELRLSPMPDGGVVIDILAHDESDAAATSDAQALTVALQAATSLDLGLLGSVMFGSSKKKFIQKGSFEPDGSDIRGEIVLTRQQLETVLDLAGGMLGGSPRPRPRATASGEATPAPAPSVP
jgi:hypothetical protein